MQPPQQMCNMSLVVSLKITKYFTQVQYLILLTAN